jgi:hypothetical protein
MASHDVASTIHQSLYIYHLFSVMISYDVASTVHQSLHQGSEVARKAAEATAKREANVGRAVQVDPMNATLKGPGCKRLKLGYDEPLANFAYNFNLCRYTLRRASWRSSRRIANSWTPLRRRTRTGSACAPPCVLNWRTKR